MVYIGVVPSGIEDRKVTINQDYLEGVLRAGGTPVLFPVTQDPDQLASLLDRVSGLLLTGGGDIDPALYGEEKRPGCGECSPSRDAMEYPLCRAALERRMPVLAICRGLQVLSCVLGGTLYQDLAEEFSTVLSHPRYEVPRDPVHDVLVRPDTLLSAIVGEGPLPVNSRHHQGIHELGAGLRISAESPDGLAEAIELPDAPFVLGVQWHPESLSDRYPAHQRLFDAFIEAAAQRDR